MVLRTALAAGGVLVCAIALVIAPWTSDAATPTPAQSRLEARLKTAQERLAQRRRSAQVLTTDITALSRRTRRLRDRIAALDARSARLRTSLDRERRELDILQRDLRQERARLVRLRARLRRARVLLARRLSEQYRAGRPDLVTVVLTADGFAELLERAEFLRRISEADARVIKVVRVARDEARSTTTRLVRLEARQARTTARAGRHVRDVLRTRTALDQVRANYQQAAAEKRRTLGRVKASQGHLQDEVTLLSRQQARITVALQRAAPSDGPSGPSTTTPATSGGGRMIWPVNGPITSPFCERRSYEACHPGLDIGAPEGTPIRAAASGSVTILQPTAASGGYGNYTCIRHAGALSSCYAHQQRFGTTAGASVSKGDVIGYVGNTGRSFGAHLHWEVRVSGAVVNPTNYL